ncbi:MAG: (2Fe-2S)-binding protein [Thermoanaerobaculia bacterium]
MIVCLCRAKSDRDVLEAIEEGARSVSDLRRCGIGTECGSCHDMLRQMLARATAAAPAPPGGRDSEAATSPLPTL